MYTVQFSGTASRCHIAPRYGGSLPSPKPVVRDAPLHLAPCSDPPRPTPSPKEQSTSTWARPAAQQGVKGDGCPVVLSLPALTLSLSLSSRLSSSPSFFFPPSHLSLLCVLLHHIHPSLVALDAVQPSNACLLSALPSQPPPSPTLNPPTFVLFPNVPGLD